MLDYLLASLRKASSAQRMRLLCGSDEPTVMLPSGSLRGPVVEWLLAHKSTQSRGGTVLRDVINHFHAPVECHQESLEAGDLYDQLAPATRRALNAPKAWIHQIFADAVREVEPTGARSFRSVRLWSVLAPVVARVLHRHLFSERCDNEVTGWIVESVRQTHLSIKGIVPVRASVRWRLIDYIERTLVRHDGCPAIFGADSKLPIELRAKHLVGVFFHTGLIQIVEFTIHALVAIAQHPRVESALLDPKRAPDYLSWVLDETLRLYPLFGVTNRVLTEDIQLDDGRVLARGTQLVVDFEQHQRVGWEAPESFLPERWQVGNPDLASFMPFGRGTRRCPAARFAQAAVSAMVMDLVSRFIIRAPLDHVRSIDDGGLCIMRPRGRGSTTLEDAAVAGLGVYGTVEQIGYQLAKLFVFPRTVGEVLARREAHFEPEQTRERHG